MKLPFVIALLGLAGFAPGAWGWSNHTLGSYLALQDVAPLREAPTVEVEPLEQFLAQEHTGLVALLQAQESFAREHFRPTEIVSSDACRAMVSDDENDQSATPDAFELLNHIVGTRLRRGLLTVVDATNVQSKARAELVSLARRHHGQHPLQGLRRWPLCTAARG